MDARDINRMPPSREFLEQHVDAASVRDYLSTRSPVFKERPVPTSKKEAIDLMVAQPNLIKRPILIKGKSAVFGFDRPAYRKMKE